MPCMHAMHALRPAIRLGPADSVRLKLVAGPRPTAPHRTPPHPTAPLTPPTPHLNAVCAGSALRDAKHLAQGIAKEEAACGGSQPGSGQGRAHGMCVRKMHM